MDSQVIQWPSQMAKVAQLIVQQVTSVHNSRLGVIGQKACRVLEDMQALQRCRSRLDTCLWRGWLGAAKSVAEEFQSLTRNLPHELDQLKSALEHRDGHMPRLRDVFEDLQQLENEFGEIRWCQERKILAVTTEYIVLEDIQLGPFEIRLDISRLNRLPSDRPYSIVALEPHPAASNDSITHPHVSDEILCAGNAGAAIVTTLSTGRICDFFVLVRSVLTTYNPNSPYVSLDRWEGVACEDCGYTVGSDDTYYCTSCEQDYCGDCISSCHNCQDSTCRSCLEECPICGDSYCRSCMTRCPDCRQAICSTCLDNRSCSCHEEEQEETSNGTNQDKDQPPRASQAA
ncbi:MAG: hypothetical protein LLG01_16750 [Planctomycetaceae bacterium]|nr:hypothetical protein [Planctomycetaceae bacterium]